MSSSDNNITTMQGNLKETYANKPAKFFKIRKLLKEKDGK